MEEQIFKLQRIIEKVYYICFIIYTSAVLLSVFQGRLDITIWMILAALNFISLLIWVKQNNENQRLRRKFHRFKYSSKS